MTDHGVRLVTLAGLAEDPEPASAWDWILSKAQGWIDLGPEIYAAAHEAARAAAEAKQRGDLEGHAEGKAAVVRLMDLWRYHGTLADRLLPIVSALGIVPWVAFGWTSATVIAVALGMRWVEARFGAEREVLELLKAGELTAAEAAELIAAADQYRPGLIANLGTLLVAGAALWIFTRGRR
jgi:hypothetical protein